MKILIVDDDPVSRAVLGRIIEAAPEHQVTEAVDGEAAWTLLDDPARSFDVVFLDLGLPEADGFEVFKRIRGSPLLRSTAVVLCTAANDRATVVKAVGLGAKHYIVKPCTPEVVNTKLQQIRDSATPWPERRAARF